MGEKQVSKNKILFEVQSAEEGISKKSVPVDCRIRGKYDICCDDYL